MKVIYYLLLFLCYTNGFSQTVSALDTSFGNNGIVSIEGNYPGGIKVLSDGKILFLAYTNNHISLIRLMPDGSIDNGFSAETPVIPGVSFALPKSMFVQPDGKVLVLTATDTGPASNHTLFRFNADGAIDTSFGVNGYVANCFQSSAPSYSYGSMPESQNTKIACDPSTGTIFISAATGTRIIASYTSSGVVNTFFNGTGFKTMLDVKEIKDLAIDPSGKIVAVGYSFQSISSTGSTIYKNWVCRLNTDGSMDTTFSGDGVVAVQSGTSFFKYSSNAVYFKDNGSMVIAGSRGGGGSYIYDKFIIYELASNGDLVNMSSPLAFDYSNSHILKCYDMVRDNDGKYILGGGAQSCEGSSCDNFGLLRLNSNYSKDTSFGVNSWVTSFNETQHRSHYFYEMAVQPDNKIVVLGGTQGYNPITYDKIYIARYLNTTTLSSENFQNTKPVIIFPNPVNATLNISVNDISLFGTSYEMVDINGRTIHNGIITETTSLVNVEKLSQGIYFIKFEKGNFTQKFIKQ